MYTSTRVPGGNFDDVDVGGGPDEDGAGDGGRRLEGQDQEVAVQERLHGDDRSVGAIKAQLHLKLLAHCNISTATRAKQCNFTTAYITVESTRA